MTEAQYDDLISRLQRIEDFLKPLEEDTSYKKKIVSTILGNIIWSWLNFGSGNIDPGLTDLLNPGRNSR